MTYSVGTRVEVYDPIRKRWHPGVVERVDPAIPASGETTIGAVYHVRTDETFPAPEWVPNCKPTNLFIVPESLIRWPPIGG